MSTPMTSRDIEALTQLKRGGRAKRIKFFSDVFPYLLIPVVLYNLVAAFSPAAGFDRRPGMAAFLDAPVMSIPMLTGVTMQISWGELFVVLAVICLFVEVIKSTNTASTAIVNHILSMILFVICLMQLLMFESFATGTFFIIASTVLVDALAGMIVTIISARRDFGVEGVGA